jgi:hypothetical protein
MDLLDTKVVLSLLESSRCSPALRLRRSGSITHVNQSDVSVSNVVPGYDVSRVVPGYSKDGATVAIPSPDQH